MNFRSFLALGLLTALLLVSCAPAAAPEPAQPETLPQADAPVIEEPQDPPPPTEAEPAPVPTEAPPTEAPAVEPVPEFVPRGPDLEATDPSTVSLASGDLQLIEFFRFT
jgi:hypothetical protein